MLNSLLTINQNGNHSVIWEFHKGVDIPMNRLQEGCECVYALIAVFELLNNESKFPSTMGGLDRLLADAERRMKTQHPDSYQFLVFLSEKNRWGKL